MAGFSSKPRRLDEVRAPTVWSEDGSAKPMGLGLECRNHFPSAAVSDSPRPVISLGLNKELTVQSIAQQSNFQQNKSQRSKARQSKTIRFGSAIPGMFCAAALGLVACADPPAPVYPEPPPPPPQATPTIPPPPTAAPQPVEDTGRSGQLNISSDIRSACGITDTEASFGYDSDRISLGDHPTLGKIARCFSTGALAGKRVRLIGHADPRGDEEYNFVLGERRAQSVREYMVRSGLSSTQILTTSRGELDAKGIDDASWKQDRRVDVLLGN